jgi:hypothetical protein
MPRPATYTRAVDTLFDHSLYRIMDALDLLEAFGGRHALATALDAAVHAAEGAGYRAKARGWRDRQRNAAAIEAWREVARVLRRLAEHERLAGVRVGFTGRRVVVAVIAEGALLLIKDVRRAVRRHGRRAGEKDWVYE